MGNTSIEWCDKTWNPTRGCSRVSPGCVNCYAERQAVRFASPGEACSTGRVPGEVEYVNPGPFAGFVHRVNGHPAWTGKVELIESMLDAPLHWRKPCRVFVNSMSDLFHEDLSDEAIDKVFAVMALCPRHTFQILTKRPERMQKYFADIPYRQEMIGIVAEYKSGLDRHYDGLGTTPGYGITWRLPLPNIWLGCSVEDQQRADERIPLLLETPAAVRFVSYEPALGPVDFRNLRAGTVNALDGIDFDIISGPQIAKLDWIIVGGESGPGARPFEMDWMRSLVTQGRDANVQLFCKQVGAFPVDTDFPGSWPIPVTFDPQSGRVFLKDRKGGDINEWPEWARVREFPAERRSGE